MSMVSPGKGMPVLSIAMKRKTATYPYAASRSMSVLCANCIKTLYLEGVYWLHARVHEGQAEDPDEAPANRGPGAWHSEDGGRGPVLHRRPHPGQCDEGGARECGSA